MRELEAKWYGATISTLELGDVLSRLTSGKTMPGKRTDARKIFLKKMLRPSVKD